MVRPLPAALGVELESMKGRPRRKVRPRSEERSVGPKGPQWTRESQEPEAVSG